LNGHPRWGDTDLGQGMAGVLPGERVEVVHYTSDTASMAGSIQSCSAVLAMRLHAGVLAFSGSIPFAQIAYHEKCADFAKDIDLPEQAVIPSVPRSSTDLSNRLDALLRGDRAMLYGRNPAEARALAMRSMTDIGRFIYDREVSCRR
jgi:polysaccharide pyruvyl transferase WcaK-like protein